MQNTILKRLQGMAERTRTTATTTLLFAMCSPAFAGGGAGGAGGGISGAMDKAKNMINEGVNGLTALGLVIVTAAILFVGFRMIFRAAQWADLAPVFWGGLIVGSAATIAGAFL